MKHVIANSSVEIISGNICDSKCEVIVSSDDSHLSQGGGVSMAIAKAGGDAIAAQIKNLIPVDLGDVAVTTAGELSQKYIFHAVTIDWNNYTRVEDEEMQDFIIRNSVSRCFQLLSMLKLSSIAFPIIGAGVAGIPGERAGRRMAEIFAEELGKTNRGIKVELWIYGLPTTLADSIFSGIANANNGKTLLSTALVNAPAVIATGDAAAVCSVGAIACGAAMGSILSISPIIAGGAKLAKKLFGKSDQPVVANRNMVDVAQNECPVDGTIREVFISYSRQDARCADWVCDVLNAAGISYWRDVDGTYSGQNYKGVIVRAIRSAHTVLFLSSKSSNASTNVVGEIGAALHFKKHVVPVKFDDAEYHDDLLLDMLNLDNIDVDYLGREKSAEKICKVVLLNRANSR